MSVFEWGSGNSTLWFAQRVHSIVSTEHHILWKDTISTILPSNARIEYVPFDDLKRYPEVIARYKESWDLILIDGMSRNACIDQAIHCVSDTGIIVIDNTDTEAFTGCQFLRHQGFSERVFIGKYAWATNDTSPHTTTVFYKNPSRFFPPNLLHFPSPSEQA